MARVLVVDDDELFVKLMCHSLKQKGHTVEFAVDGQKGWKAFSEGTFDVVVCDIVMPEQEGIETIKLIRRDYPTVKVIAMSGAFGGDYLRIAGYLGAHGTIAKPLRIQTVLDTVAGVLKPAASA